MKLRLLYEVDLTRRGLLRGAATVLTGGPFGVFRMALGPVGDDYARYASGFLGLDAVTRSAVEDFTVRLLGGSSWSGGGGGDYSVVDGVVSSGSGVGFPLKAVLGRIASLVGRSDGELLGELGGYEEASILDDIDPGFRDAMWRVLNKKRGFDGMVDLVRQYGEDSIGDPVSFWQSVLDSNDGLRGFLGLSSDDVSGVLDSPALMGRLVDRGLFSKGYASNIMRYGREAPARERERKVKLKKGRAEYGKEQEELVKSHSKNPPRDSDLIDFDPRPDDYLYGSAMHQPVESRFAARLFLAIFG